MTWEIRECPALCFSRPWLAWLGFHGNLTHSILAVGSCSRKFQQSPRQVGRGPIPGSHHPAQAGAVGTRIGELGLGLGLVKHEACASRSVWTPPTSWAPREPSASCPPVLSTQSAPGQGQKPRRVPTPASGCRRRFRKQWRLERGWRPTHLGEHKAVSSCPGTCPPQGLCTGAAVHFLRRPHPAGPAARFSAGTSPGHASLPPTGAVPKRKPARLWPHIQNHIAQAGIPAATYQSLNFFVPRFAHL